MIFLILVVRMQGFQPGCAGDYSVHIARLYPVLLEADYIMVFYSNNKPEGFSHGNPFFKNVSVQRSFHAHLPTDWLAGAGRKAQRRTVFY